MSAFLAKRPNRKIGDGVPSPGLFSVPSPSVGYLSNSIYPLGRGAGVDTGKQCLSKKCVRNVYYNRIIYERSSNSNKRFTKPFTPNQVGTRHVFHS